MMAENIATVVIFVANLLLTKTDWCKFFFLFKKPEFCFKIYIN